MRFDYAQYAHPGGRQNALDALRLRADDELFALVLCDETSEADSSGVEQSGGGSRGAVASFVAEQVYARLESVDSLRAPVILNTHQALRAWKETEPAIRAKSSTIATLTLDPRSGALRWATVGNSRVCLFKKGAATQISPDDSAGYEAYLRGEIDREGIRLSEGYGRLTASLGGEREPVVHEGAALLAPGDAVLVCSDGFWEYVFDLEVYIDLQKSDSAEEWLRLMLLRLVERSFLTGDALSAVACLALGYER
jgi:serine/threonine protein phosphatase PrpC